MMTSQRKNRLKYKIQDSRARLLESHPFFALLLMYLKFVAVPGMKKITTNGRCIYFAPEFVDKLYTYELDFILCHQIMHIIYGHIWRPIDREGDNYHFACDILINTGLYNCGFTDNRYPHLGEIQRKIPGENIDVSEMTAEEIYTLLPYNLYILDERVRSKFLLDNDLYWSEQDDSGALGEIVLDIEDMDGILKASSAIESGSSTGGKDLEMEWKGRVGSAVRSMGTSKSKDDGFDNIPDFAKRMIKKMKEPIIDWKKILNNFLQERTCDYSFSPPDRRFSDTGFFLPDFNEKDFVTKEILFMVDTSGSVKDDELAMVYSEIKGAIEQFAGKLTGKLGFFDADVTPPLPFESVNDLMNIIPYGGGGTDFFAIFDFIKRNDPEELPACIVIFTDGDAPYPDESDALGIPVLWIINNFICTPPWGRVRRIMPLLTEACEER